MVVTLSLVNLVSTWITMFARIQQRALSVPSHILFRVTELQGFPALMACGHLRLRSNVESAHLATTAQRMRFQALNVMMESISSVGIWVVRFAPTVMSATMEKPCHLVLFGTMQTAPHLETVWSVQTAMTAQLV